MQDLPLTHLRYQQIYIFSENLCKINVQHYKYTSAANMTYLSIFLLFQFAMTL